MTARGYIIAFSLTASVSAAACWLLAGHESDRSQAAGPAKTRTVSAKERVQTTEAASERVAQSTSPHSLPRNVQVPPASAAGALSLSRQELELRAARVEQEANHDLRRLVQLLDLTEEQQDRVFQKLAERSPSWTPALQVASADGAVLSGKRGESYSAPPQTGIAPGTYGNNKKPATVPDPVPVSDPTATTDPYAEILELLDPGQQDALLKAEMDRIAWWAEILPQITPPDDLPALDGTPVPGQTKEYEGADVLE
ncbi:MAG TPA: hypothetical protein VG796_15760 [Verrucomicrobiales bacterium]|jgi:hypothetical protein|nr:hypothetical protein [Verrucomicrobiales bacterium]